MTVVMHAASKSTCERNATMYVNRNCVSTEILFSICGPLTKRNGDILTRARSKYEDMNCNKVQRIRMEKGESEGCLRIKK